MSAEWSDREVWTYLAERWAAAVNQGSAKARVLRLSVHGLCGSLLRLRGKERIARDTRLRLLAAMRTQPESKRTGYVGFWWPPTVRGAASRAAFCRRMARAARGVER